MKQILLEVCCGSVASARIAQQCGADRIELCNAMHLGGLTPDPALLTAVRAAVSLPLFVMIRPWADHDCYTAAETDLLQHQIEQSIGQGADGIVFGARTSAGQVDEAVCRRLLQAAGSLPVTYHRAFDKIANQGAALETLVNLGFCRILTSGGAAQVSQGLDQLTGLIAQARGRVIILPGGGLCSSTVAAVARHLEVSELHGTFRAPGSASGSETDPEQLAAAIGALRELIRDNREAPT